MMKPAVVRFAPTAVQSMHDASIAGYPNEACGILIGRMYPPKRLEIALAVAVPNAAPAAEQPRRYVIEPRLLLEWERAAQAEGRTIVGFFHSHPDHPPAPSATDAALAWPTYAYVIVSTMGRSTAQPLVSGMAAWTFDDASSSFRELEIELAIEAHEIEYYI